MADDSDHSDHDEGRIPADGSGKRHGGSRPTLSGKRGPTTAAAWIPAIFPGPAPSTMYHVPTLHTRMPGPPDLHPEDTQSGQSMVDGQRVNLLDEAEALEFDPRVDSKETWETPKAISSFLEKHFNRSLNGKRS